MADELEPAGLTPEEEQMALITQMEEVAALRMKRDELERLERVAQPDAKLKLIEEDEEDEKQRDLKLNLDGGAKRKIVRQLGILLDKAKGDMANMRTEWDAIDGAYDAKMQPRPYAWQSNMCSPVVQVKCDKVHGGIIGEIGSSDPIMPLEPQEESDVPRVRKVEKFIHAVATKEMKLVTQTDYVASDAVRYGTGIMECPWVHETESTTEVMEFDGLDLEDMQKFEEMFPKAKSENPDIVSLLEKGAKVRFSVEDEREIYRGPRPKHLPLRDLRVPKGYNDPNKMPFQFKRFMASWAMLEDGVRQGKYEQSGLDVIKKSWETEAQKKDLDPDGYIKKEYEVFEGWWLYNTVGDVREKCVFTVVPEFVAYLRGMKYPFTHNRSYFIEFKIMEKPDSFFGYALGTRARKIQYLMNMIINNAIDSDGANWPMYVHKTTKRGQNLDRQGYRPFKVFEIDASDELLPLRSGANSANSLKLYGLLQRVADDATRVSEMWTGSESKQDPDAPAAKTKMLLQVSQQGLIEFLKVFLKGWTELTFQICELYAQYGTKGKEFRILNEDGEPSLEAAPGDLNVRVDMQPMGANPIFTEEGKKNNLVQLMTLMIQDPVIQALVTSDPAGSQAWLDNWERLLSVWGGGLDKQVHDLIGPLKQIIQNQVMQAQQQQQAQQEQARMSQVEAGVIEGQVDPGEAVKLMGAEGGMSPMGG